MIRQRKLHIIQLILGLIEYIFSTFWNLKFEECWHKDAFKRLILINWIIDGKG